MSYLAKRSSHPLSCNGDSSSEDDVFVNPKLDVYADYYDKSNSHSYFVDLYDPECAMTDNFGKQNKQTISPLFSPRSPDTPRRENDAIIFAIKFCGKNFGEVGLFEPDISILDWEGFRMYLFSSLNLENPESFVIYYRDDESDRIPIESEAEYKEALKIAKDKAIRQEKFVLDINRNTIGFPSLRSLVTSSIRRVNSVGSSVKAIPGPIVEKKDVTTSTSFSSLWGSLESLSISTDHSELSEDSDGLEMTAIQNPSMTALNFIIDVDTKDCVIKRIMPTKEKSWSRLGIKTYKIGYHEYNRRDTTVICPRPLQHLGQQASVGKMSTIESADKPKSNNSGRNDEVSFYCSFYYNLENLEKPIHSEIVAIEPATEVKQKEERNEQPKKVEDQTTAPIWFTTYMQQLKEEMSQEISSKINERFEDLVGNFNVVDVEERLRGVIKGYGSGAQERVICCCKGKECRRMHSIEEYAQASRLSMESEDLIVPNLWNIDLLKEELEKREKEILSCIDDTNERIKSKINLFNDLRKTLTNSQGNCDLDIEERERVLTRIEDVRHRQSKSTYNEFCRQLPFPAIVRVPLPGADSISKSELENKTSVSPDCVNGVKLPWTKSDLSEYKTKISPENSSIRLSSPNSLGNVEYESSYLVCNDTPKSSGWSVTRSDSPDYKPSNSPPYHSSLKTKSNEFIPNNSARNTTDVLEYDAKFISDENFPDGSVVQPGVVFSKTWLVMNTGSKPWDQKTVLVCANYDASPLVPCERSISCPHLQPGETGRITVTLRTPDICGNYFVTKWKFVQYTLVFGNMLWCNIKVQQVQPLSSNACPIAYPSYQDTNCAIGIKDDSPLNSKLLNIDSSHLSSNETRFEINSHLLDNMELLTLDKELELKELLNVGTNDSHSDIFKLLLDSMKNTITKQDSEPQDQDLEECEDDDDNYEDLVESDEERSDYNIDNSSDSSDEYSEDASDEDELKDQFNVDINSKFDYHAVENKDPANEGVATMKEQGCMDIIDKKLEAPNYLELENSSMEFNAENLLAKERYLTEDLEIPAMNETVESFEQIKDEECLIEVPDVYKDSKENITMSEVVIASTAKESEIDESESDDDSSASCKVEDSSESDTQQQLLTATLRTAVAPEDSLAAELAAAAYEDISEKVPDVKENSQSSEDSNKKEKSALQEHFKQNVEINLEFEFFSHSSSREESPSPTARAMASGQVFPLTFKERHFTISHLPPPNPTIVPDSDDDDLYDGLVFIRAEDVPSSAPETAPGTPSASEDHRSNQGFPHPSESERSERSESCSSLSDYKNADDEDSDNDSESGSSFSGVDEEDHAEVAATGDNGVDDLSSRTNVLECYADDSQFYCYKWENVEK